MKKLTLFLLLATAALPAFACVQLNPAYVQSGPNITSSNDSYASYHTFSTDGQGQQTIVYFYYGAATLSGSNCTAFTHDANSPTVTLTLNWGGGSPNWLSSAGTSGTLSSTDLTNLNAGFSGGYMTLVNALEALGTTKGLFGSGATNKPWSVNPALQ